MGWRWSWLLVGMVGLGCGALPEEEPVTPADETRAGEEWPSSEAARRAAGVRGGPTQQTHCIGASRIAQVEARQQRYRGAAGFGNQGCGPGD